jgi:hypothetical protein
MSRLELSRTGQMRGAKKFVAKKMDWYENDLSDETVEEFLNEYIIEENLVPVYIDDDVYLIPESILECFISFKR